MPKIYAFFKETLAPKALWLPVGGFALLIVATMGAQAKEPNFYDYDILRNGKQIGFYHFEISNRGDTSTIKAKMEIEVKLLFVTAYKATHKRVEAYQGDALKLIEGDSMYNGKNYTFTYKAREGQLTRNGETEKLDLPVLTLTPFAPDLTKNYATLSEKGKTHPAHFEDLGMVNRKDGLKLKPFRHVKLVGEVDRELWFTPEGILDSLSYQKDGATISFKRR